MSAPQRVPVHLSGECEDAPTVASTPHDPLARLLAIEGSGLWPADRPAYKACLMELAEGLRRRDPVIRWAFYSWLEEELVQLLHCRDPLERQTRRWALEDVAFEDNTPDALEAAADRVAQPNLLSFLQAKVIWRSNDVLESKYRRHSRRVVFTDDPMSFDERFHRPHVQAEYGLTLGRLLSGFPLTAVEERVLRGIADDQSVAAVARRTGRSRQQIYRLFERLRDFAKGERP